MKKRELTATGKEKLRESSDRLYSRCRNPDDARSATESVAFLERLILAQEAQDVEPLVLKDLEPRGSTPTELEPHLPSLLAQAKGLVSAAHRHRIDEQRLAHEAALSLYRLVPEDDYRALARLIASATEAI